MSLSWKQRKDRLSSLLSSHGEEDAEGLALDRLMHGQSVIGKTSKTIEVDALRFRDRDLNVVGTLAYGQFGVIDVVTCRLDNRVYVRKSIEKRFALRTRDQCSPQFERDILLQSLKTNSPWAPHLLCAYQTTTHLNVIMDYAEGGTLWDVLESSPHDGRVIEADLQWWMPQIVSAIHWCHSQGFAHRDIKPHNFVLTPNAHVLLIDFGSAAPLLAPNEDGSQLLPRRYCLVPCGTCDYISPEILQAHEEALVALEMDEDVPDADGYGVETDWWSLGAMLYEMAYGVAPFFAPDIRQTYLRIMSHEKSLKFDQKVHVSHELQHFLRRLLTRAKQRLGRRNVMEITDHPLFEGVDWATVSIQNAPDNLHLPQFTYSQPEAAAVPSSSATDVPLPLQEAYEESGSMSQGFAFSAFFQQSSSVSPGVSILRPSPLASSSSSAPSSFIGFSWGPAVYAFPDDIPHAHHEIRSTPRPLLRTPAHIEQTPIPATLSVPLTWGPGVFSTPGPLHGYMTPMKPYAVSPHATLPRTSTVRRTALKRSVSDREAMKQLVGWVGMSARKKVLESGRKPKIIGVYSGTNGTSSKGTSSTARKELRFDRFAVPIPGPDYSGVSSTRSRSNSHSNSRNSFSHIVANQSISRQQQPNPNDTSDIYCYSTDAINPELQENELNQAYSSTETTDSESGGPPSPSPSPRPGSAMSMMSMTMLSSRRSGTPTASGYFSGTGSALRRMRSGSGSMLAPLADRSLTTTTTMTTTGTTSSGLLSIPSAGSERSGFWLGHPPAVAPVDEPVMHTTVTDTRQRKTRDEENKSNSAEAYPVASISTSVTSKVIPSEHQRATSTRVKTNSSGDPCLDDLERRHSVLMRGIEDLEERFDEISVWIAQ